jgi:hypothetical protein
MARVGGTQADTQCVRLVKYQLQHNPMQEPSTHTISILLFKDEDKI